MTTTIHSLQSYNTPSEETTAPSSSMSVESLEERASEIVLAIQRCVESLRSIKEFNAIKPAVLWSALKANGNGNTTKDPLDAIAAVDLYAHFQDQGIVQAVQSIIARHPIDHHDAAASPTDHSRRRLTMEVLLPLARSLSDSYESLDRIPAVQPQDTQSPQKTTRKKAPPPPPPGLLSLQNYTDIGAFLEFTVCTSILPFLQPNILFPVQDRARYFVPKSLAGRIARPSLLWASQQQRTVPPKGKEIVFLQQLVQDLQTTVVVLGKLLLLDRFRPMLLPRHLSDLYAAIFQAEAYRMRLQQMTRQQKLMKTTMVDPSFSLAKEYDVVRNQLLVLPQPTTNNIHNRVDPALQAQSLQALLLQGTKSPPWLRQRVAAHLTQLASRNLSVIFQVFVHAAPPKDKTAASLRLARTLITPSSDNNNNHQSQYFDLLVQQMIQILDGTAQDCHRHKTDSLTQKQTLDIHTVWAILDQLPTQEMQTKMMRHLSTGMLTNINTEAGDDSSVHQTVQRMAILLSSLPPSMNAANVAMVLFLPLEGSAADDDSERIQSTIFGQMLRLACVPAPVIKTSFHDDVTFTMKLALHALLQSNFASSASKVDSVQIAAMALVYATAPSDWDNGGNVYTIDTAASSDGASLSTIRIVQPQKQSSDTTSQQQQKDAVTSLESRVALVLKLINSLDSTGANESPDTDAETRRRQRSLSSAVFYFVLLLYFSNNPQRHRLPVIFRQTSGMFRIVAMCFIPLLCETCPPENLLKTSQDDGAGIFQMMQLVFACAVPFFSGEKMILMETDDGAENRVSGSESDELEDKTFIGSGDFFSRTIMGSPSSSREPGNSQPLDAVSKDSDSIDSSDVGMIISVTSLMLGLLVTIMDYGTTGKRSNKEEAIIQSFPSLLHPLAEVSDLSWMRATVDGDEEATHALYSSCGEIAELAGHALALLAARQAPTTAVVDDFAMEQQLTPERMIEATIRQSQSDLSSNEAPIRAKGVVSLQRLLRGHLFQQLLAGEARQQPKVLIVEVEDDNGEKAQGFLERTSSQVLELCVSAISDPESYVYLAAIQCIATMADICPRDIIPRIGLYLASGKQHEGHEDGGRGASLTSGQRVKLAEALMFCIRRRAKIDEYVSVLLDIMLFGEQRKGTAVNPDLLSNAENVETIQRETHQYFLRGRVDDDDDDVEDLEEKAEKQRIRINTGGPVFLAEETDLVTAARVSIVSELLPGTHPSTLAQYCHALATTAVQLLRLDASRPVRRAAAFLAREFYMALLREQTELLEMAIRGDVDSGYQTDLELSTALMETSDDELLRATLTRCLQADDLDDLSQRHRAFDSATVARCQEALDTRQEAVDGGLFAVARLVVESRKLQDKLPAANLVRDLLQQSKVDRRGGLGKLRMDVETLELK
ncbi:transmembrane and coiled-coil domains 7 [Seminavis robusta]|uniref:Transmembrane and coiled-coil domains 7 n=1 Tax=Seminavis robusta TaxID=568900 RepID=A0A9N8HHQ0_9STRA|nr:transmembrane and coiled-coil domains 7 [Seminavis robusta]|eukprot:Sro549_g164600.1 transmembrane and coiled-coil domains 7 (1396) ;mRNA; r:45313-49500